MSARPLVNASESEAEIPQALSIVELILMLLAVAGGTFAAAVVLPLWLPGLAESLLGSEPKAFWYLARTTGVVAYLLLWLTIVYGLVVSNKMARLWNGGPTAVELHQFITWLAVAFGLFHALILMGDKYIKSNLTQIATPFAYAGYEPFWVGLGQVAFYLTLIVAASVYVRKWMGYRAWRTLHYLSFVIYFLLTLHGFFSGTDTKASPVLAMYTLTSVVAYFLLIVRILNAVRTARPTHNAAAKSTSHSAPAR
ncbi:MAG: ferric reductase-like transmembrane domain-containing protein [Chloroflexi bacterium]|nr:ferric reductase-like transmembrane domain-containing protein [Chloroflexota bacterium]